MTGSQRAVLFFVLAATCLHPRVGPAVALTAGILFSLVLGNPGPARTSTWARFLLQASVVGLGFGLRLDTVWRVGVRSAAYTVVGIAITLAAGLLLGRLVGTSAPLSTLISFGTAICGGSAIAAMAPVVKAKSDEIAVSLATVFTLNATALLLFPAVGHLLNLGEESFGLWAGLAIHDTSSVVGAASAYGPAALAVATTVKLTRALWIMPCVTLAALLNRSEQKARFPLFIAGFLAAAAVRTLLPWLQPAWTILVGVSRQCLVLTLYLIGAGLTREVLRRVGVRPLAQGVLLWALAAGGTLFAITSGLVTPP